MARYGSISSSISFPGQKGHKGSSSLSRFSPYSRDLVRSESLCALGVL